MIKEITDINLSVIVLSGDEPEEVENFTKDELNEIMDYIATFWFVMTFYTVCELSDVRTAINNNRNWNVQLSLDMLGKDARIKILQSSAKAPAGWLSLISS